MSQTISRKSQLYTRHKPQTRLPMRKLISFQIGTERYALPIEQVQHILMDFTTYGSLASGQSLVRFNHQDVTLVDLSTFFAKGKDQHERNYLIVCILRQGERLGLPVPNVPTILEVSEAQFSQLPELYRQGSIPAAVEKLIHVAEGVEVFYLNLAQLVSCTNIIKYDHTQ